MNIHRVILEGMVKIVSPELGGELRRLYSELPAAYKRAAEALRTNGEPLEGDKLQRFLEEDAKAAKIVARIKEIQGQ
ncbi:hypothetical protein [Xanthobacter oligotrophicus]|uniref:hypothetical protein n=1 Tax=Xanthobacter oligotrophicus TaxID=2607286 RepID=UPI0011F0DC1F|nr:hypothetical protein [Xanthobacter oligotrophicus]MCG5233941.1 hypothetical protein [Xanthobacter oligotrophicus]